MTNDNYVVQKDDHGLDGMSSRSKKSDVDNLAYPAKITQMAGIFDNDLDANDDDDGDYADDDDDVDDGDEDDKDDADDDVDDDADRQEM